MTQNKKAMVKSDIALAIGMIAFMLVVLTMPKWFVTGLDYIDNYGKGADNSANAAYSTKLAKVYARTPTYATEAVQAGYADDFVVGSHSCPDADDPSELILGMSRLQLELAGCQNIFDL